MVGVVGGHDGEPGAGGGAGGGPVQGPPGDALAPAVHGGLVAVLAAPVPQGGQDAQQRVAVDAEFPGEGVEPLVLDRRPEGGVPGVGRGAGGGGGCLVGPEPQPAERVGGQVDAAGAGAVEQCRPVESLACRVQPGHGGDQGLLLVAAGAQGRDGRGGRAVLVGEGVQGLLGEAAQDSVGAEFEVAGGAAAGEGAHTVAEADRLADVPDPVPGVAHLRVGGRVPGEVRDQGQLRRGVRHTPGDPFEVLKHGVHVQ